jgi:hypothetical protein
VVAPHQCHGDAIATSTPPNRATPPPSAQNDRDVEDMGVMGFADANIDAEMANDEHTADQIDAARLAHITEVALPSS